MLLGNGKDADPVAVVSPTEAILREGSEIVLVKLDTSFGIWHYATHWSNDALNVLQEWMRNPKLPQRVMIEGECTEVPRTSRSEIRRLTQQTGESA